MNKIFLPLLLLIVLLWPASSWAISFSQPEISSLVKVTSYLSDESVNYQMRSLKDYFISSDEARDYRQQLEAQQQWGSGFMVTYSGCALTNKHVVYDEAAGSLNQKVHLWSTSDINKEPEDLGEAVVVYYRTLDDLALVCLNETGGRFFERLFVKTSAYEDLDIEFGETIYTLGWPENGGDYLTLTSGITSGKFAEGELKTTMPITAGASGSPIFNKNKQVIGIAEANTGPFDQLGLFLGPKLVWDWFNGYKEVYRSIRTEDSAGCQDTDQAGIYLKNGQQYYDLACSVKRDLGLESKLTYDYQNFCGGQPAVDDLVEAAGYIADGRSTITNWQSYLEQNCSPLTVKLYQSGD